MTLFGLALVLAATFCHAIWNFQLKRLEGGPELVWLFSAISTLLYLPVIMVYFWLARPTFDATALGFIAGSTLLHMAYFLLLQQGYRRGDLSLVYLTARATGPLLSVAFAIVVLGEAASGLTLLGGAIIVGGVLFLTGGIRRVDADGARSLAFGLGAGSFIAAYTVWDAYAVAALAISPLVMDFASMVSRSVLLAPVAHLRRPAVREHWRRHRGAVLTIALFNPLAYILVLYALSFTPVVYVAPARELSVVVTVLLGSILLGEGQLGRRLRWAAVILVGMIVLGSG